MKMEEIPEKPGWPFCSKKISYSPDGASKQKAQKGTHSHHSGYTLDSTTWEVGDNFHGNNNEQYNIQGGA